MNTLLKIKKSVLNDGRFYLQDYVLNKSKFTAGKPYSYLIDKHKATLEIIQDDSSTKVVSKRTEKDGEKPVIDIRNKQVKELLEGCAYVTVSIYEERIIVVGHYNTAQVLRQEERGATISSMTFCAGAGVSAWVSKQAGFEENYLLEFNPLDGANQWDRYSHMAEVNHPDSVVINVPIEEFSANMLPHKVDVWMLTLPCNEFSIVNHNKTEDPNTNHSMQHFLHTVRILSELPLEKRPECIFVENVPSFEKIAGKAMEYFLSDLGYHVSSIVADGADYGSRMHRGRYYMVANIYRVFNFPQPTGEIKTPFMSEEWFNLDDFDWKDTKNNLSINRLVNREKVKGSQAMNIKAINPATEGISYTIPKQYRISVPQGMVKHPTKPDTYAIWPIKYLKKLFGLPGSFYVGQSETAGREAIGQSVDTGILTTILNCLYDFLMINRLGLA